jgi:putative ABC transport system permease protein
VAAGLRTRPLRVFLSALGIAIGIAAMVSVVGISSSAAEVDRQLAALGTNLLTVAPGNTLRRNGDAPDESVLTISRIGPVERVAATGKVPDANVYRTIRSQPRRPAACRSRPPTSTCCERSAGLSRTGRG